MKASKKWLALSAGSLLVAGLTAMLSSKESENTKRIKWSSKRLQRAVGHSVGDDKKTLEDVREVLQKQLDKVNKRIEELA
jgi:CRISPR/Cas system CSM-associated protein Csm2 small subunit